MKGALLRSLLFRPGRQARAATFVVAFDLHHNGDYSRLFNAIKRVGEAIWCLETVWFLSSTLSASEIHNHLSQFLADDDRIIVVLCGEAASWGGFADGFDDWLSEHI